MDTLGAVRYNKAHMTKHKNNNEPVLAPAAPSSKRYDEASKRQAVEHWLKSGKVGTQIARELGEDKGS